MRSISFTRALALALIAAGSGASGAGPAATPEPVPRTVDELKVELERILSESKTPGMALAIVRCDAQGCRDEFVGGLGLAEVAGKVPADADTMFRIGSTSKAIVAIAALKLAHEGRLDLEAPLRSLAPEVEFENRWEETDPVRIVHLLEHTTGWDDIHLRDYANEDPRPDNLAAALAHDPDSRTSRWRPGTRMAYCNAGPAVAAFVIAKIVGEPFEDWAEREVLRPIGMARSSYFLTDEVKRTQAKLYQQDGVTPFPYWHIALRPAGSVNSSARDMAAYVRFHLRRGQVGPDDAPMALLTAEEFDRLEHPRTNLAAAVGLTVGYGLHNYSSVDDAGFVWQGHNGGVQGGASDFSYLPAHGVGYSFLVNGVTDGGFPEIAKLLRRYLTQDLPAPADSRPSEARIPDHLADSHTGFYLPISPRVELIAPLERVFGVARFKVVDGAARFGDFLESDRKRFVAMPDAPHLLRREDRGLATLALLPAEALGAPGLVANTTTFVRAPAPVALAPLALFAIAQLLVVAQFLFAPVWVVRRIAGRIHLRPHLEVRLWPLAAGLALFAFLAGIALVFTDADLFNRYGAVSVHSLGVATASVLALLLPWFGLYRVMRAEHASAHAGLRWFAILTLLALAMLMAYLASLGMVPFVTWT